MPAPQSTIALSRPAAAMRRFAHLRTHTPAAAAPPPLNRLLRSRRIDV
ncbi:hypothetical protein Acr_07g0001270 [Actinidia rufa]|uniref:Uncharacterized protein n=1 Tax=Actinidia rufa TaxID=165716 RepID=A0A7J0EUA2_9ERIC|nr:hypothetical protein Acr_07g0001270 [Actinidia rufa]